MTRTAPFVGLTLALAITACRPDPGAEDYASQEVFHFDAGTPRPENYVEGPDPWVEGEPRLSLGLFYEGGASEAVTVDDIQAHFYIYEGTFAVTPVGNGQREGIQADAITHAGTPWWGGGIHFETPRDFSTWTTLRISLRATDAAFAEVALGLASGVEEAADAREVRVQATDYGYTNDGRWHDLVIPLADLTDKGLDLGAVRVALLLVGGAGTPGETLLVDALYLTAE